MSIVILDSGPLGLLAKRGGTPAVDECNFWLDALLDRDSRVILPEIADFEVRRELIRLGAASSIARLDALGVFLEYLPLTTAAMRKAAELWAVVRQQGLPTADPKELDGDVILAAQALMLGTSDVVVATTNAGHLSRFVTARQWAEVN